MEMGKVISEYGITYIAFQIGDSVADKIKLVLHSVAVSVIR